MVADPELLLQQVPIDEPLPDTVTSATDLLLPPDSLIDRLRHFPEEVYDLSAESNLVKFMKVILGDAGAGQLRKRLLMSRLRQTLQGSHFFDLDRFYGALFGLHRQPSELLTINPYTDLATSDEWAQQHAKDASYRSRIIQFGRALGYGSTPTGMELIAEAVLSVDCDIYEPGERVFTIRPKRVITLAEAHDLRRVVNRIKPADTRFEIDDLGVAIHTPISIRGIYADSEYWEVVNQVAAPVSPFSPYTNDNPLPTEQPRPPFAAYQGEAWSYIGDITGVTAYTIVGALMDAIPMQKIRLYDGTYLEYPARNAIELRRRLLAGRAASDGVLVAHPYAGISALSSLAPLFADAIALERLLAAIPSFLPSEGIPQRLSQRFWVTPDRPQTDTTQEVLEVRFPTDRVVNYITFEMAHYPHTVSVQFFDPLSARWEELFTRTVSDSSPSRFARINLNQAHPQHWLPSHWIKVSQVFEPETTGRIRFVLTRGAGAAPTGYDDFVPRPYSLGLRGVDIGYRVNDASQVPPPSAPTPTIDVLGSPVVPKGVTISASRLNATTPLYWKSDAQPVNFAVVNLYLDARDGGGLAQVIDRFFLNPTHAGPTFHIYYSNADGDPASDPNFFENISWTPISRDYTLQKGYVQLPPTKAKYFNFEFTNLVAEPHEAFVPLTRTLKLFYPGVVEASKQAQGAAVDAYPPGRYPTIGLGLTSQTYSDAINVLQSIAQASNQFGATETIYAKDPNSADQVKSLSWVFGFTPWHMSAQTPHFTRTGRHQYQIVEFRHATKVGFFVGLQEIKAYRVDYTQDDDSDVYWDHFNDDLNLVPGYDWEFSANGLSTGTTPAPVVESQVFNSMSPIEAIQFATQQTEAVQLIPDDDFTDPALASYDWSDPANWTRYGDANLLYSPGDNSVYVKRFVTAPPVAVARSGGIIQDPIQPVFEERTLSVEDIEAEAATYGGIQSPSIATPPSGYIHAAVRVFLETALSSPLLLQIVAASSGQVLAELSLTGQPGEMLERWVSYRIGAFTSPPVATVTFDYRSGIMRPPIHDVFAGEDPATEGPPPVIPPSTDDSQVYVRLIQEGKSDDTWRIDTLSLFDQGIVWEFSPDGGAIWYDATLIRNNDDGVLTFATPWNQLKWRAIGTQPHMAVSALQIRPWYVGPRNVRTQATHRGPNVSIYDQEPPIEDDPMFTAWKSPIPRSWFYAARRYPLLPP
jgi:hypothetical protein